MQEALIVEAVRTPIAKARGAFAEKHPTEILGAALQEIVKRSGIAPGDVDQVVGGCVTQAGEQSCNVARNGWLIAALPYETAATTIDAQCGSAQQAVNFAAGLVATGGADVAIGCGVEAMTRVGLGMNVMNGPGYPWPASFPYETITQFEAAERIARKWGITREDVDAFGAESQRRAIAAWDAGWFSNEVVAVDGVERDTGLRESTVESLTGLKPVIEGGIHTPGNSSQLSDGAAAVMLASAEAADRLNLEPRARIVAHTVVGVDPNLLLHGPIEATRRVLQKAGMTIDQMDTIEINEAFASVVLAWAKEHTPDMSKVNPQGGAIALGHPVGSTGARLITTALHTLERTGGRFGLVTMCCGGGLGTGTIIDRAIRGTS
jgi:acetyl-CoA C-acetyltransferase